MHRFGLRDDQWNRIQDLLPGRPGTVGVTAEDNRLFVVAVLYRYRTGCPWRDLLARFGDWKHVNGGSAGGRNPESGSGFFSISQPMQTTNTR